MAESWPIVRANRWLVERLHRRVIQVRFPESWSSTFSGEKAVLAHRAQDISVLTTPSLLSRVERFHRRVIQVRFPESWSSTFSGEKAVLTHRPGYFCLDNAFALIEGTSKFVGLWTGLALRVRGTHPLKTTKGGAAFSREGTQREGQPAQQVRLAPKTRREPGAPC